MSKLQVTIKPMGLFTITAALGVLSVLAVTRGKAPGTAVAASVTGQAGTKRTQTASENGGVSPIPSRKRVAPAANLVKPVLEYRFDDAGQSTRNTGRAPGAHLILRNENGPADLHSADGVGVSGKSGDKAFDNTKADAMGSKATSGLGVALSDQPIPQIHNMKAYTVYGWMRTGAERVFSSSARVVESRSSQGSNLTVLAAAGSVGGMQVEAGGKQKAASYPVFRDRDVWVAFAVTVDASRNSAVFFRGDQSREQGSFFEINRASLPFSPATGAQAAYKLALGNSEGFENKRPLDGMLDNIRVYDHVLTLEQLEAQRLADLK